MKLFGYHMPASSLIQVLGLGGNDTVTHMSLIDLFKFGLNTIDGEEELHGKEMHHSWNLVILKG